jgi:hypothetical protein
LIEIGTYYFFHVFYQRGDDLLLSWGVCNPAPKFGIIRFVTAIKLSDLVPSPLREKPALNSVEAIRMSGILKAFFFFYSPHPRHLPEGAGVFFLNLMPVSRYVETLNPDSPWSGQGINPHHYRMIAGFINSDYGIENNSDILPVDVTS